MSDDRPNAFAIEMDPLLIEAALSAVDKATKKSKRPVRRSPQPAEDEVMFDPGELGEPPPEGRDEPVFDPGELAEPADAPAPAPAHGDTQAEDLEHLRLQLRVREQGEHIQRLEQRLARATEISDGLDQQVRELRTFARRLEADADLVRQRHRREREEAERRAEENSVRGLIDVVDNVERAVAFAEADPGKITAGLQIIREQFRALLRKLNIERISAEVGTPFDPAIHEAVLHQPTAEVSEGSIVSEVSVGFRLRGRLLRPARVVVAAPPPVSTAE